MDSRFGFTKQRIDTLPTPEDGKRTYYYDSGKTAVNGLILVVTGSGRKSFQVYKKLKNQPLRVTLGQYPNTTIEMARRKARKVLADIDNGINPNVAKKADRTKGITLGEVFEDYLKTKNKLKPGTIYDYKRIMRETFEDWLNRPMKDITTEAIQKRHFQRGKSSKARANNAMRVLRALFNFARVKYKTEMNESRFPVNPVNFISETDAWFEVRRRRTKIEPDQLKDWYGAVMAVRSATGRDYLLFLLFTGLRREEGLNLHWDDIDLKRKTLTVRDTKNKEPHILPLSDYLYDLLARRDAENRDLAKPSSYVFPSPHSSTGHLINVSKYIIQVREQSGIHFTPHDLRRTFATITESLDISHYTVKRLLNHKMNSDVTAGYIIFDTERLRGAMQKITDHILRLADVKAGGAVVNLTEYQRTIKS